MQISGNTFTAPELTGDHRSRHVRCLTAFAPVTVEAVVDGEFGKVAIEPLGWRFIGHGGYVQCIDPDRLDHLREARRDEQAMLGGDSL